MMDHTSTIGLYLGKVSPSHLLSRAVGQRTVNSLTTIERVRRLFARLSVLVMGMEPETRSGENGLEFSNGVHRLILSAGCMDASTLEMLALLHALWEHHSWNIIAYIEKDIEREMCDLMVTYVLSRESRSRDPTDVETRVAVAVTVVNMMRAGSFLCPTQAASSDYSYMQALRVARLTYLHWQLGTGE